MFAIISRIYPKNFVDFFICNSLQFLDDIFHKLTIQLNIQDFYKALNEFRLDLQKGKALVFCNF